ncbi:MAG: phospholipase D-like domain-containing protein [Candidatus Odinarchaeia archaeon]
MVNIIFVATGERLLGQGIRSTYSVANEMIANSEQEILMITFSFTKNIIKFIDILKKKIYNGIRTTVILNNFDDYDEKLIKDLQILSEECKHFQIINFSELSESRLHMKVLIIDRKEAILGSANFTWSGMLENYEIGVKLDGGLAEDLYFTILKMIKSHD